MEGTAKELYICRTDIKLGDWVQVKYTGAGRMCGGTIEGKVTELWSPDLDKHYQGRVESGWCFHDHDEIIEHREA